MAGRLGRRLARRIGAATSLVVLALVVSRCVAFGAGEPAGTRHLLLTPAEQQWIAGHSVVRIQMGESYPPFEFRQDGRWQGMCLDYLAEVCRRLGLEYRVTGLGWSEALKRIAKGQDVDLVLAATHSPERESLLALSKPYLVFPQVIFIRKNAAFVGSVRDLAHSTIAVEKDYVMEAWLRRDLPAARFLTPPDTLSALKLLASGKADAYVGNLAVAEYLIEKKGLIDIKVAAPTDYGDDELCMGARKDWPELAVLIDKALASFSEEDHRAIRNKWLSLRIEHGIRARDVIFWALLVAGVGMLFIVQLRRAVKIKTAHLEREIEEHRRAQEELRQSKDRYAVMFHTIHDAVFIHDLEGKVIDVNQTMADLYGVTREEARRMTIAEFSAPGNPIGELPDIWGRVLQGERSNFEWVALRPKDGACFPVEVWLQRVTLGGSDYVLATVRDIIERTRAEKALRESEQRYRSLFDSAGDAIFILKDDLFIDCNTRTLEMFGCLREEIVGHSPYEVSPPVQPDGRDSAEKAREKILAALAGLPQRFEWLHRKKNGTPFLAEVSLSPLQLEGVAHLLAIVRDISERRNLERRLSQAQKMEAIGTLAGGIAHDFNNILSIMTGYVEVALLKIPKDSSAGENLRQVITAGERASQLVSQILTFSRKAEAAPVPCDLRPIVKETVKFMQASLPASIQIRERIDPVGVVVADPTQVHQVIMNLCTNAFHAMEGHEGVLEISLREVEIDAAETRLHSMSQGRYALLTVSDTGCGMAPEVRDRIFEPYFSTKPAGKGTGLGLAVVHGIVTAAGGQIKVYSEAGAGTAFHIYLPLANRAGAADEGREPEGEVPSGTERVLLVDDESAIVAMLGESLEALGYAVTAVTDSEEALRLFKKGPGRFDLVITDLTMPRLNGASLVREMRAVRPGVPIILCTGFSEGLTQERLSDLGVGAVLTKPIPRIRLGREIRRVLDGVAAS